MLRSLGRILLIFKVGRDFGEGQAMTYDHLWLANCYFACRRSCNIVASCPRVRRIELVVADSKGIGEG